VNIRGLVFRATFRTRSKTALLAILALLALGCAGRAHLIRDDLTAKDLEALVDSDSARGLLADLLARRSVDARLTALAPGVAPPDVVQKSDTSGDADQATLPDQPRLRELSQEVSLDFAALSFARAISADGVSRAVQASFHRFLQDGVADAGQSLRRPGAFPYTVLFAPSWMYRSHPETGSDFAYQRRLLDRLGIVNRLIASRQDASVEDNAAAIAAAVRAEKRDGKSLIVVSASKSGAEDGPNDGAVLLADTVWPGGITLAAIGPDHLFAPQEDDAHSLAMLRAVAVAIQLHRLPSEPAALVESTPRQRREIFIGEDGFNR